MSTEESKVKETRSSPYDMPDIISKTFKLAEVQKNWLSFNRGKQGHIHRFEVRYYKIESPKSRFTVFLDSIENYKEVLFSIPTGRRTEFRSEIKQNVEDLLGVESSYIKNIHGILNTGGSL